MSRTPVRARGLVDPDTGDLVAVTGRAVTWLRTDGSRTDLTPDEPWECVAVGGGAVAVSSRGTLAWHGPDGSVVVAAAPDPPVHRLGVSGAVVVGADLAGGVTLWRPLAGDRATLPLGLEPEEVLVSGEHVGVWGWDSGGGPRAVLLRLGPAGTGVVRRDEGPGAEAGLVLGLDRDLVGVAGEDGVVLVLTTGAGDDVGRVSLPGLRRVVGRGSTLAWLRSPDDEDLVVGVGRLAPAGAGPAVEVLAEAPVGVGDPFPELACGAAGEAVVVAGEGPARLRVRRLSAAGWAPDEELAV